MDKLDYTEVHLLAARPCYRQFLNWPKHWNTALGWVKVYLNACINRLMPLLHPEGIVTAAGILKTLQFVARSRVHKLMRKVVHVVTAERNVLLMKKLS